MFLSSPQSSVAIAITGGLFGWFGGNSLVQAQVIPDNTLPGENSQVTSGTINGIPSELITGGAERGSNLFHSFQDFNVPDGRGVFFANPAAIANIFSRVTGGNPSFISGTLGVLGEANLFLLNPSGIVFGPNAQLSLGGSFFATNANRVLFEDGSTFSAFPPESGALLTMSVPMGLQMGPTPGGIFVQGEGNGLFLNPDNGQIFRGARPPGLAIAQEQTLGILGGPVVVDGQNLTSNGGSIEVGSVTAGTVKLIPQGSGFAFDYGPATGFADVTLSQASLDATGANAGGIQLRGSNVLLVNGSDVSAEVGLGGTGQPLVITADNSVVLSGFSPQGTFSQITSQVGPFASQAIASDINIQGREVVLADGAAIFSQTLGLGDTGAIQIQADESVLLQGVNALGQGASIGAIVGFGAIGNGREVRLNAPNILLSDGAQIAAFSLGNGNASDIRIQNANLVQLAGADPTGAPSQIQSVMTPQSTGNGGIIELEAQQLQLSDQTAISALTFGTGSGAALDITAGAVQLDNARLFSQTAGLGPGGDFAIAAESLVLNNGSQIILAAEGAGAGGSLRLDVENIRLTNRAEILAIATNIGAAGDIESTSSLVSLDDGSLLRSQTVGEGAGGRLTMTTQELRLQNGSQIILSTSGSGNGGSALIEAADVIQLNGLDPLLGNSSGIFGRSEGTATGRVGNLSLDTAQLLLHDGAQILSSTAGTGAAGDILIRNAEQVQLSGQDAFGNSSTISVFVESSALADGGDLTIQTRELQLLDGADISSTLFGQGSAGDLSIVGADMISLSGLTGSGSGSTISTQINPGAVGAGGDLTIDTRVLTLRNGAQISASTLGTGDAGNLLIQNAELVDLQTQASENLILGLFTLVGPDSIGNGGDLTIQADTVQIQGGALISSSTEGQGNAGNLAINNARMVQLGGVKDAGLLSGIVAQVAPSGMGEGGTLTIQTEQLQVADGAQINSSLFGAGQAGEIQIRATHSVILSGLSSSGIAAGIFASVEDGGQGNSGRITIETPQLQLAEGATISSSTSGSGDAGELIIRGATLVQLSGVDGNGEGSKIASLVAETGVGNAGNLTIETERLTVNESAEISTATEGLGDAANLAIAATESATVQGGRISAETLGGGEVGNIELVTPDLTVSQGGQILVSAQGNRVAGTVDIQADQVVVDNGAILAEVEDGQRTQTSPVIALTAESLSLSNNSQISADTTGLGDAGTVAIDLQEDLSATDSELTTSTSGAGSGGDIKIRGQNLSLMGSGIRAETTGTGNPGSIDLSIAQTVDITTESQITTDVEPGAVVNNTKAGNIRIATPAIIQVRGGSEISARVSGETVNLPGGVGSGGNIELTASERIELSEESMVATSTEAGASGVAGNISVQAPKIKLQTGSQITASTDNASPGGSVEIVGDEIVIADAAINASGTDAGAAGNLTLQAEKIQLTNGELQAETNAGRGNIFVNTDNNLVLQQNSRITTNAQGTATGGNITITTGDFLFLLDSSVISANAIAGDGGNIKITTQGLIGLESAVTATSERGVDGTVEINDPSIEPEEASRLPSNTQTETVVANACAQGSASQFIDSGRGGLPTSPISIPGGTQPLLQVNSAIADSPTVSAKALQKDPGTLMQMGYEQYQDSRYLAAANTWLQAAKEYQNLGDSLNFAIATQNQAAALVQAGRWQSAATLLESSAQELRGLAQLTTLAELEIIAQYYSLYGATQLALGEPDAALKSFQDAEQLFRLSQNDDEIIASQINQAQTLIALGFHDQAVALLEPLALAGEAEQVWGLLGDAYRRQGNYPQAETALQQSLVYWQSQNNIEKIGETQIALGNLALNRDDLVTAANFYQLAIGNLEAQPPLEIQAQLNYLRARQGQGLPWTTGWEYRAVLKNLENQTPSRQSIQSHLNLVQLLVTAELKPGMQVQLLKRVQQQAEEIGDQQGLAYSLGFQGKIQAKQGNYTSAIALTLQALNIAEALDAPEIAYLWLAQLGRLYDRQGNRELALNAYAEAFQTMQVLRGELAAAESEIQYAYRQQVEPIYRDYIELLLRPENLTDEQATLAKARTVLEALQLAELDNFFRDACTQAIATQIDEIDPAAVIVYPIMLPDRLEIILKMPGAGGQLRRYRQREATTSAITQAALQVYRSLRGSSRISPIGPAMQSLHRWLIETWETDLSLTDNAEPPTLVFVLDGILRNLPMAGLFNGETQEYLIERYAVAIAPGLQLVKPEPLQRDSINLLAAGADNAESFLLAGLGPLENVSRELSGLQELGLQTMVLVDQDFQEQILGEQIQAQQFNVVHLATHGNFSSNPEETYVLDWDGRLGPQAISEILQPDNLSGSSPVELLVLSACETAEGDDRASLGLAGMAVRAGARSTIGTLWQVDDASTADFMVLFYKELQESSTKAEALRRAQLKFIQQGDYQNPFFWAPFILVGNWL
ncbi:MAG: CHAT domain-containing protein [Cyanobacteria bacterium P01_H01_bin.15]